MNLRGGGLDPAAVIAQLRLQPHPEGGHYQEAWRDAPPDGARGAITATYYLLVAGQRSHWHQVDTAEAWHFYADDPLRLHVSADGPAVSGVTLGADLAAWQVPSSSSRHGVGRRRNFLDVGPCWAARSARHFSFQGLHSPR